jgi:hypothetical protein
MTKTEWLKVMERCHTHNDFFKPYDIDRNRIWFAIIPDSMTLDKAFVIVDDFYRHNKGNIRLADFEAAIKGERAEAAAKQRAIETTQLIDNRAGDWPTITDETRAMIRSLKNISKAR